MCPKLASSTVTNIITRQVKALLRGALVEILVRCRSADRPVTLARVTREVALAWQESREVNTLAVKLVRHGFLLYHVLSWYWYVQYIQ